MNAENRIQMTPVFVLWCMRVVVADACESCANASLEQAE
jgi:hypothetical protein